MKSTGTTAQVEEGFRSAKEGRGKWSEAHEGVNGG